MFCCTTLRPLTGSITWSSALRMSSRVSSWRGFIIALHKPCGERKPPAVFGAPVPYFALFAPERRKAILTPNPIRNALCAAPAVLLCCCLVSFWSGCAPALARRRAGFLRRPGRQAAAHGGQYRHHPDPEGAARRHDARPAAGLAAGGPVQEFPGAAAPTRRATSPRWVRASSSIPRGYIVTNNHVIEDSRPDHRHPAMTAPACRPSWSAATSRPIWRC